MSPNRYQSDARVNKRGKIEQISIHACGEKEFITN